MSKGVSLPYNPCRHVTLIRGQGLVGRQCNIFQASRCLGVARNALLSAGRHLIGAVSTRFSPPGENFWASDPLSCPFWHQMLAKSFFCEQVEVVGLAPGSPKMASNLKLEHLGGRDLNFSAVSIHFAFWGRWIWGSRACTDVWE